MKLPRLLPFKRTKAEKAGPPPDADGVTLARERAMEQIRLRRDSPPPPDSTPPPPAIVQNPSTPDIGQNPGAPPVEPEAADPLAGLVTSSEAPVPEEAQADPLAAAAAATAAPADVGADLLDIFRDAKQETEEGSLAGDVEDVPIEDLLADLRNITNHLGVKPRRQPAAAQPSEPDSDPPSSADEQPPETGAEEPAPVIDAAADDLQQPLPEPSPDTDPDRTDALATPPETEEPDPPPSRPEEAQDPAGGPRERGAVADEVQAAGESSGRRYILHALFFGLALSMAAGFGIRGARTGALAGEYDGGPTPAVLAYLQPPVIPETIETAPVEPVSEPAPASTFAPEPSPSPLAAPLWEAEAIPGPAYFLYTVQYGDSLSSIASDFDVCPDHILWNNPGRKEEDPLMAGDRLLLPGVRGVVHTVRAGESVAAIAAMYSVRPENIVAVEANHLSPGENPSPGTRLLVPDGIPPAALLRDAEAHLMTHTPSMSGYVWPYYGPITTFFGEQRPGYTHLAIDIGGLGSYGAPVGAAAPGTVATAVHGDAALGNYVTVQHDDGARTVYAHLSEIYVAPGQTVNASDPLGALGCTGHSTGTHLHFELWIDGTPVDPLDYLP